MITLICSGRMFSNWNWLPLKQIQLQSIVRTLFYLICFSSLFVCFFFSFSILSVFPSLRTRGENKVQYSCLFFMRWWLFLRKTLMLSYVLAQIGSLIGNSPFFFLGKFAHIWTQYSHRKINWCKRIRNTQLNFFSICNWNKSLHCKMHYVGTSDYYLSRIN